MKNPICGITEDHLGFSEVRNSDMVLQPQNRNEEDKQKGAPNGQARKTRRVFLQEISQARLPIKKTFFHIPRCFPELFLMFCLRLSNSCHWFWPVLWNSRRKGSCGSTGRRSCSYGARHRLMAHALVHFYIRTRNGNMRLDRKSSKKGKVQIPLFASRHWL